MRTVQQMLVVLSALAASGCGPSHQFEELGSGPGRVLEAVTVFKASKDSLESSRRDLGLDELPAIAYGVECLRVVYETTALGGALGRASGLVCLPEKATGALPLVSYQHGTEVSDLAVPSGAESSYANIAALGFAGGGYVVAAADYLGLGASDGVQPYLHAESSASASLDMIRAARHVATAIDVPLNGRTFLAGFSQGGHATLALLKSIEEAHADEVHVIAAVPISGPYALSKINIDSALKSPTRESPLYLALLHVGYGAAYGLFQSLEAVFRDAEQVHKLLDGAHSFDDVVGQLPSTPDSLFRPEYLAALRDSPSHPLRIAAKKNDLDDWRPSAVVRLCHGESDHEVPFENALSTARQMKARGADVEVVSLGDMGHAASAVPCTLHARRIFDSAP